MVKADAEAVVGRGLELDAVLDQVTGLVTLMWTLGPILAPRPGLDEQRGDGRGAAVGRLGVSMVVVSITRLSIPSPATAARSAPWCGSARRPAGGWCGAGLGIEVRVLGTHQHSG
jgi:hypothetical protein